MGRTFPNGDNNASLIHPLISTSFFLACISATFAIISSICGFLLKKSRSPDNQLTFETNSTVSTDQTLQSAVSDDVTNPETDIDLAQQQPLPPPPGRPQLSIAASYHCRSESATSSSATNLAASRSMRVIGAGLGLRQGSKRDDKDQRIEKEKKKEKNLKHEDSIWKKTIILGDKCRVPDEDDDAIVYDEKGNRISTYHHRKNNSMALSRQGSAIDQDAVPSNLNPDPNDD